ncbi:unnamed protein product [Vitrella brassicaformis CCMP3155]|uniref:Uncharacterized protein n=1 Tax=Vitrella brassicaformis (strain CCMP3155) TaxID=1169540 RepID=A0A0G4EBZ1_VITBC|nr:unnamed protein product [Vitrella brassicaformis CCMP3155]|eukprot:CEL92830.1 unnamed protein product [Vitrella brassicaformis CCMP3155]
MGYDPWTVIRESPWAQSTFGSFVLDPDERVYPAAATAVLRAVIIGSDVGRQLQSVTISHFVQECKAFLESVRGTLEGQDMKIMINKYKDDMEKKEAAKTSTAHHNQHQQQPAGSPAGSTKKVLVRAKEWGDGADGYYASALTQWDLGHWERQGGLWVVTWTPPTAACCCMEAGRAVQAIRLYHYLPPSLLQQAHTLPNPREPIPIPLPPTDRRRTKPNDATTSTQCVSFCGRLAYRLAAAAAEKGPQRSDRASDRGSSRLPLLIPPPNPTCAHHSGSRGIAVPNIYSDERLAFTENFLRFKKDHREEYAQWMGSLRRTQDGRDVGVTQLENLQRHERKAAKAAKDATASTTRQQQQQHTQQQATPDATAWPTLELPDVYADDRRAFTKKVLRFEQDHPKEFAQWMESMRGTQEGREFCVRQDEYIEHLQKKKAAKAAAKKLSPTHQQHTSQQQTTQQKLLSRGFDVPDVYADDRRAFTKKVLRIKKDHREEFAQWMGSLRGTQEGRDVGIMLVKFKEDLRERDEGGQGCHCQQHHPPATATRDGEPRA